MKWARLDREAIRSGDYVIRRGGWFCRPAFRLYFKNRLIAICPSAERAKELAASGMRD